MIYTITKSIAAIKVSPAVSSAVRLKIENGFRLAEVYLADVATHHFIAGSYTPVETFTMFQMVDETSTDADIEMVRQILQKHEEEDAASQLRMARHREQMSLDMGMGGDV